MRRPLLILLILLIPSSVDAFRLRGSAVTQSIAGITLSNSTFPGGSPTGTTVGDVIVGMSGSAFTGSVAFDTVCTVPANCADNSKFQLAGPGCAGGGGQCTLQTSAGSAVNPAFVAGHGGVSATNTLTIPAATAGNTIVGMIQYDGGSPVTAVNDNAGNSYTMSTIFTDTTHNQIGRCFYKTNILGAPTSVSATGGAITPAIVVDEYSGANAVLDVQPIAGPIRTPGAGGSMAATTITTIQANDVVWSAFAETTSFSTPSAMTALSGTQRHNLANFMLSQDQVPAPGSVTASATAVSAGAFFIPCVLAMKPSSAGIANGAYKVSLVATQSGAAGSPFTQALTVTGLDAPTAVTLTPPSATLSDNCQVGTCPATLSTAVATMGSGASFTGTWSSNNTICAVSAGGAVTLNRTLSGTDDGSRTCTITATQNGISAGANLTLTIQPQVIATTALSNATVPSGSASGTTVGTLSSVMFPATPPGSVTYSLGTTGCAGTNNANFSIATVSLKTSGALSDGNYIVCVVSSQSGLTAVGTPFTVSVGSSIEIPGPSAALFNNPYYTCVSNRYVGGAGASDSNNGLAATVGGGNGPWLTIQKANDTISNPSPGMCINVAPGTYSGVELTKGGNLASAAGYLVYRCTIPGFISGSGCLINSSDHAFCFGPPCGTTGGPNYIFIDGFVMDAVTRQSNGQGIFLWNGSLNTPPTSAHHIWITNNIIRDYGQSGVQMNDAEYFYVIHNETTTSAYVTCGARGSGISFVLPKAIAGYTPTADDTNNPVMGLYGPAFPYKIVANWNVTHINSTTTCGQSDGNGIIADSFHNSDVSPPVGNYPGQTLVAFNVIYNNGGSGFQAFLSDNVTVANNSVYNNYLNTNINGTERSNLDIQGGFNNLFVNNISYSVTGTGLLGNNNAYNIGNAFGTCSSPPCAALNNNLSFCTGKTGTNCAANFNGAPAFSCSTNKCDVNPLWVAVGNTSTGSDTVNPVGTNFALQPTSQAIGYGQTKTYLSPQAVDAGACHHALTTCP